MSILTPGANASLAQNDLLVSINQGVIAGVDIDVSAFLVGANGKVRSDNDMCFYGQPSVAHNAVQLLNTDQNHTTFSVDLGRIPVDVEKIIFTATIHENKASFGALTEISLDISSIQGRIPCQGLQETALILAELYKRNGAWKVRVVGQGFNGGLSALATHLGVSIDDPQPQPAVVAHTAAPPSAQRAINLEKKLLDLSKTDPTLVSLVKKVGVLLTKKNLLTDKAKVVLCLDISGSMQGLYSSGAIDTLVQRIMALGYRFDDDGTIDVFLFGENVHAWGEVDASNYKSFVQDMRHKHALEGGTRYGRAIERIRAWEVENNPEKLPVYVMFVTDGGTDDKPKTQRELREASKAPIFWQFMAIGTKSKFSQSRFEFLEKLDELDGRLVDNANAFQVANPSDPTDEELFTLLMAEYPQWLKDAQKSNILPNL